MSRVAWVCGEERMLAHVVTLAYREQLRDAERRAAWVDVPGWWDDVLSVPSGPRLTIVWNAEHLGDLSKLPHLLGDELDGSYTVFVSAEHDFRKQDKELVPALAALRDSRHGQIIRCSTPASQEDQAAIVASWWPGAGRNIAAALLEASGGSLTAAWHAADKAVRAGFPCDPSVIPVVCVSRDAEGFADLLTAGNRAAAMAAARTLPQDEAGGVLALLAVRLQLLPLVRDCVERGEDMQSMVRNLKASQLVIARLRAVSPRYGDSRVSRCRELLAIAETAWRSGARDGVLEAVAALW